MVVTVILVLALCGTYVMVISALALIFYLMNPSPPEPIDFRVARRRGIA